jgi:YggT family protein
VPKAQLIFAVQLLFRVYYVILFARVILSWLNLPPYHPFRRRFGPFLILVTEPLLRPVRRLLHRYQSASPLDFSPLVLYLLLYAAEHLIVRALALL